MAKFSQVLCVLGILVIIIPSILCDHTYEKHVIHVPVFIHYVHHHHILKRNRAKPKKKWRRIKTRIAPGKYVRHFRAHTYY